MAYLGTNNLQMAVQQKAPQLQAQNNASNAGPGGSGPSIAQDFGQRSYTFLDQNEAAGDVIRGQQEVVTTGLFAGNTGSFVSMFTSSNLTATQKTYYQELFSSGDPAKTSLANSELSIAYGHFGGSGSKDLTGNLNNDTPSRAIYKQYAQLLLEPDDKKFTINGVDTDSIYILNFNRSRMREELDPGNFEITFAFLSGSRPDGTADPTGGQYKGVNATHTGSAVMIDNKGGVHNNEFIQVIDDSSFNQATVGSGGPVYNLISGSIDGGTDVHNQSSPTYFGLLFPKYGVAVLNGNTLDTELSFNTVTGSQVQGDNPVKLFLSVSGSDQVSGVDTNGGIQARASERTKASYFFCRVKSTQYNYSNNPSFTTGSEGRPAYDSFVNNPQSYITTVGLYNNSNELLAVAKLSQPLLKNYTREALIRVKLDF